MVRRAVFAAVLSSSLAFTVAALAGNEYTLSVTDGKAAVGAKGTTEVIITGKNGWHVNEDAPISMKLTPAAGVSVDKAKLSKADLAERTKEKARFAVTFTAAEPGRKIIDAETSFVMCQASACKQVKEKLALAVDVVPADAGKTEKPAKAKAKASAKN